MVVVRVDVVQVIVSTSVRVRSGPVRKGDPAAIASFFNRPMNDSAAALIVRVGSDGQLPIRRQP